LEATRSQYIKNCTGAGDPSLHLKLKKFAGQGSAVTFPVQSIVYTIICITAVLWSEGKKPTYRNIRAAAGKIRVFGDDICLPSDKWLLWDLSLLFQYLELEINVDKTHFMGDFRESCGGDYWYGNDVTPIYFRSLTTDFCKRKQNPKEVVSWVECSNNFHMAAYLRRPQEWLRRCLRNLDV
jgi:hypothetical protein